MSYMCNYLCNFCAKGNSELSLICLNESPLVWKQRGCYSVTSVIYVDYIMLRNLRTNNSYTAYVNYYHVSYPYYSYVRNMNEI